MQAAHPYSSILDGVDADNTHPRKGGGHAAKSPSAGANGEAAAPDHRHRASQSSLWRWSGEWCTRTLRCRLCRCRGAKRLRIWPKSWRRWAPSRLCSFKAEKGLREGACRCVAADRKRNRLALRRPPYSRVGAVPSTLRRVEGGREGRVASVEQTSRLSRAHVSVLRRASATVQLSGPLCPLPAWFKTRSAFLLPRAVAILLLIRLLMTSHVRGQERGGVGWRSTFLRPSSACAWVCACLYRCSCASSVLPQDCRHHR